MYICDISVILLQTRLIFLLLSRYSSRQQSTICRNSADRPQRLFIFPVCNDPSVARPASVLPQITQKPTHRFKTVCRQGISLEISYSETCALRLYFDCSNRNNLTYQADRASLMPNIRSPSPRLRSTEPLRYTSEQGDVDYCRSDEHKLCPVAIR